MTRLFLQLYLVVTAALLLIGWVTELAWKSNQASSDNDLHQLAQLATLLPHPVDANALAQFEQQTGVKISQQSARSVALLSSQYQQLSKGQAIISYDENDSLFIYVMSSDLRSLTIVGPITIAPTQNIFRQFLLLASYLFLAIVILLWSRPLWQDLNRLNMLASQYGKGNFDEKLDIKRTSVVYPLAKALKRMAEKIASLLSDQRLAFNAVSHDIRTPLSRLKFTAALLPENAQNLQEEIKQDVSEIETLLDTILNYGRLESNLETLELAELNLTELINHQIQKLQLNAACPIHFDVQESILLNCDGHLIERALQNGLTNAIKYANSKVEVSITQKTYYIAIEIDDDGPGIPEDQREAVFLPFSRLETSRNKHLGGFGLGLAITKKIMRKHQGDCYFEDSNLGGAKLVLKLPL
ncbi:ATP-binding protein [Colwellia sp. MEBiC06753]